MVAFLIQPVSGECCVDPCSRSSPCDPCEPTTTTTTTTTSTSSTSTTTSSSTSSSTTSTTTLPPGSDWVCVTDSATFWSGKYEKGSSTEWNHISEANLSIQYSGTDWFFHDDNGGEADLFSTSSGGVDPSIPTWPSRITSVDFRGAC